MAIQEDEQKAPIAKWEEWADRDPCDPYKRIFVDRVLEDGGLEAELALLLGMARTR